MSCCWHDEPRCRPSFNELLDKIITIRNLYKDRPNVSNICVSNANFTGSYLEPATKSTIFHSPSLHHTCKLSLTDVSTVVEVENPQMITQYEVHSSLASPIICDDAQIREEPVISNFNREDPNVCNLGESVRRSIFPSCENTSLSTPSPSLGSNYSELNIKSVV